MIRIREGKEKNLLRHHPWVFSGAIEEATLPQSAGLHKVLTSDDRFIAWGYYDRESHIQLRLLSWNEDICPDEAWWRTTVRESVLRRKSFFEDKQSGTTAFRIIHGEADMLPGIAADVYGRIVRIIISARNNVKTRFLPRKFSLEKAKAASTITPSISAVVTTVKIREFRKYLASGTAVKASI